MGERKVILVQRGQLILRLLKTKENLLQEIEVVQLPYIEDPENWFVLNKGLFYLVVRERDRINF